MQAGTLNEIIRVERLKAINNEYGEIETEKYIPIIRTRANVKYNNINRTDDNNELFFSQDVTFIVRAYHNIMDLDRIIWNGGKYRILSIELNKPLQLKKIHTELINE